MFESSNPCDSEVHASAVLSHSHVFPYYRQVLGLEAGRGGVSRAGVGSRAALGLWGSAARK